MSNIESEIGMPVMYCSNLMLVDSALNPLRPMRKQITKYTAYMAMVQNIGTGCTQVFNHDALVEYRKGISSHMEMHDYWLTLVCMFLGKIIYDNNPHIKYRQHSNNVVGAKDKEIKTALRHLEPKASIRIDMLKEFNKIYSIGNDNLQIIEPLFLLGDGIKYRLFLLASIKYVGTSTSVTIGFKIRSILNCMY